MAKPIPYSLSRPSKAPPNALPFIHPSPNKSCYLPSLPPSIPLKRNKKQKSKAKKQKAATTPPSPQKNATFNVCPCCLVHSHREKKKKRYTRRGRKRNPRHPRPALSTTPHRNTWRPVFLAGLLYSPEYVFPFQKKIKVKVDVNNSKTCNPQYQPGQLRLSMSGWTNCAGGGAYENRRLTACPASTGWPGMGAAMP